MLPGLVFLSGSVVPIWFFPDWFQRISALFPFIYIYQFPIGLDMVGKKKTQSFIKEMNREYRTTVVLTTHDLSDIEKLCERVLRSTTG